MPGVDQILSAITQQGADELRLTSDEVPVVLAAGLPRRFTMASTPEATLRQLLGELLSPERQRELETSRLVEFEHHPKNLGRFAVTLLLDSERRLQATFRRGAPGMAVRSEGASPAPALPAGSERAATPPVTSPQSASLELDPRLVELCVEAARLRASDIHIADGEPTFLRIDGRLERVSEARDGVRSYLRLDGAAETRAESGASLDFGIELESRQRLRISVYRTGAGLAAAIRLLPRLAPALEELNLPLPLDDLSEVSHGLVLLCGATGSGKSTTLAALCRRALERRSVVLLTLEDPVEFVLPSANRSLARQRQIGRDVPDFAAGLRDALRADPDVIMVGELRDTETMRLALTAAETGHLVLASLHSGSAAGCIERMIDAYPPEQRPSIRTQLADALRAVVVQKLLPRARGAGRVPALEVLRVTHAVANVVREGRTAQIGTLLQGGKREGMLSLERCLADYVHAGVVSEDVARAAANDRDSFATYLTK
ncbi:MAG TPA: PilT/PilU family type 4a pilus ATPase [Polyangiaceae bacterium]|nr:PilT/PilU family type 4a pilus ATPase [Polyangiaceae bacterium]